MQEIIIDTDAYYQYSRGRNYPIIIYEYSGEGKVEKLHEGYIDSCIGYLEENKDNFSVIWIDYNESVANQFCNYLKDKDVADKIRIKREAYWYIKRSKFRKRFIAYWIEISPNKYAKE